VISHSDSVAGLLIDPTDALATATRRHGLALLHRFVLLEISLDQLDERPTPLPAGTAARRVHSDPPQMNPSDVGLHLTTQERR